MVDTTKFSEFTNGGELQVNDEVVGLRGGANTRFNFPGTGIKDASGNYLIKWVTVGGAQNYIEFSNSAGTDGVSISALGGGASIPIILIPKGGSYVQAGNLALYGNTLSSVLTNGDVTLTPTGTGEVILDGQKWPKLIGTSGQLLSNDGVDQTLWSTATFPLTAGAAGTIIRSNGTNWVTSTSTFADTYAASSILYSNGANTIQGLATANNGVLITSGAGVPSISSTLPTAVQDNITQLGTQAEALDMGTQLINNVVDPVSAQDAATKNYVDTNIIRKNMAIGGDFFTNPWQRGTNFTGLTGVNVYTADRFRAAMAGTAVWTIQKETDAPTVAEAGIYTENCFEITTTTADGTIGAGDFYGLFYRMEGYDWSRLAQRAFTISFWIKSNVTGTMGISFRNAGQDRSYVSNITVDTTDTWEKKTITVDASPSAGTWNYTNGIGLIVTFSLAAGTSLHTASPDTWVSADVVATASQSNFVENTNDYVRLALIQIEDGENATPFELRHREQELALCQRYYWKTFPMATAPAQNTGSSTGALNYRVARAGVSNDGFWMGYPVQMRTTPSFVFYNPNAANALWRNITGAADSGAASAIDAGANGFLVNNAQAAGDAAAEICSVHMTADAEL